MTRLIHTHQNRLFNYVQTSRSVNNILAFTIWTKQEKLQPEATNAVYELFFLLFSSTADYNVCKSAFEYSFIIILRCMYLIGILLLARRLIWPQMTSHKMKIRSTMWMRSFARQFLTISSLHYTYIYLNNPWLLWMNDCNYYLMINYLRFARFSCTSNTYCSNILRYINVTQKSI